MSTPSSKANNRTMKEWFDKIERSEIRLPRFQRPEAWDKGRVKSLMNTIIHNLPLGITLLLDVEKTDEPFVSRSLKTAPDQPNKVNEHLLDGQQRLTAFWRALHNNYEWETYFVYNSNFDKTLVIPDGKEFIHYFEVICQPRWFKEGAKRPLWADDAKESLNRGLIPLDLFSPEEISDKIDNWVKESIIHEYPSEDDPDGFKKLNKWNSKKDEIITFIRDKREIIRHYNLPFLSLPISTPKDTALQVFINMNTNSKPLSQYDIIRAEIEGVKGVSLDDYEKHLDSKYPNVKHYFELSYLILATSALLQDKLPNQRGMWDMKKDKMIENWELMEKGLGKMAEFLEQQGIYDQSRLPTNAVLAVIATLYTYIPDNLDARGKFELLLKKYLWSSFFTDRYENSAATHAYSDFTFLKNIIVGSKKENGDSYIENDVPVLNRQKYQIETKEELMQVGWPKRESIRARAIMAVFSKLGALDFADGTPLSRSQLLEGKRHYHHVFPDNLLKGSEVQSYLALNCALITDKTNLNISNKEPYSYLKDRYSWTTEDQVNTRLKSHLIPINELKSGGYSDLNEADKLEKINSDYLAFISKRSELVHHAVSKLVEGKDFSANEIISDVENNNLL